jgi:hypothetical protein
MLLYESIVAKFFKFRVLNFTAISFLTCPVSFVMIYRMQRKKEEMDVQGGNGDGSHKQEYTVAAINITVFQPKFQHAFQ